MSFRAARRYVRYATAASVVGVAAVLLPPREALPSGSVLHLRVLLEGMGRVLRCAQTGLIILVDYKYNLIGCADDAKKWSEIHLRSAHRLVSLAETNGGLYVKSGQVFASLSHILPKEYWKTMTILQDAVVKRPVSEVIAVIEADLKRPIADIFSHFDEKPIAAASLAQVHKGTLKDGSKVAIKVQYIDIQHRFRGDLATIKLMLGVCGWAFPGYDFGQILQRIDATIAQELDFVAEGRNSDRAGKELQPVFGRKVVTPFIHWDLATPRVLITDFIDGVKISDGDGMRRLGINVAEAANDCYSALAYQMFCTGFAHADPHAGNILVHKPTSDGRNWKKGESQVVLLDHGLYVDLTHGHLKQTLAQIWTSSVTHHDEDLKRVSASLGISDYKLMASMFLQHPYDHFSSFKKSMTANELELMHKQARDKMDDVNDIITLLPKEYAFVLRNISAVRAINKDLGNPVRRPLVMLRYSLRESHKSNVFVLYKSLLEAWWTETKNDLIMLALKWYQPEVLQVVEDAFAMA